MFRGCRGGQLVRTILVALIATGIISMPLLAEKAPPRQMGQMVDLGGHRLHVHCSGSGAPVVIVENGLGDFSFDWILVQEESRNLLVSARTTGREMRGVSQGRSLVRSPN